MQPKEFYDKLADNIEAGYFNDKPDEHEAMDRLLQSDAKELGLLTNCDPKVCDGTHMVSTRLGRFMWMILNKQKRKESGGTSIENLLDSLGIEVDLVPVPEGLRNEVEKMFNHEDNKETTH